MNLIHGTRRSLHLHPSCSVVERDRRLSSSGELEVFGEGGGLPTGLETLQEV